MSMHVWRQNNEGILAFVDSWCKWILAFNCTCLFCLEGLTLEE